MIWTPEADARLRELVEAGVRYRMIAVHISREFETSTHNACAARAQRLKIRRPDGNLRKTPRYVELEQVRTCQWIKGEPCGSETKYCGEPTRAGRSYCDEHCARAYQPPKTEGQ